MSFVRSSAPSPSTHMGTEPYRPRQKVNHNPLLLSGTQLDGAKLWTIVFGGLAVTVPGEIGEGVGKRSVGSLLGL